MLTIKVMYFQTQVIIGGEVHLLEELINGARNYIIVLLCECRPLQF